MTFNKRFLKTHFAAILSGLTILLITSCDKEEELERPTNLNYYFSTPSDSILAGDSMLYSFVFENIDESAFFHPLQVSWSSDDDAIATVSNEGWI